MIPGFKTFLTLRCRRLRGGAKSFWDEVASLGLSAEEGAKIARVEGARRRLLADRRRIERIDFGAGPRRMRSASGRSVEIARLTRATAVSSAWGRLLFGIARKSGSRRILELGAGVGLSAAYLQTARELNGDGVLVTVEGDPALCEEARRTLEAVGAGPAHVVEGRFADVLPHLLEEFEPFDLLFVDGHHEPVAVVEYVNMIEPHLTRDAIVILDDIQPLTGAVRPAWSAIIHKTAIAWSVDLLRMGVLRLARTQ